MTETRPTDDMKRFLPETLRKAQMTWWQAWRMGGILNWLFSLDGDSGMNGDATETLYDGVVDAQFAGTWVPSTERDRWNRGKGLTRSHLFLIRSTATPAQCSVSSNSQPAGRTSSSVGASQVRAGYWEGNCDVRTRRSTEPWMAMS